MQRSVKDIETKKYFQENDFSFLFYFFREGRRQSPILLSSKFVSEIHFKITMFELVWFFVLTINDGFVAKLLNFDPCHLKISSNNLKLCHHIIRTL